jgi:hypothetical protein
LLSGVAQHGDLRIGIGDVELVPLQAVQTLENGRRPGGRIGIRRVGDTRFRARLAQAFGGIGLISDHAVGEAPDVAVGRSGHGQPARADLEVVQLLGITRLESGRRSAANPPAAPTAGRAASDAGKSERRATGSMVIPSRLLRR